MRGDDAIARVFIRIVRKVHLPDILVSFNVHSTDLAVGWFIRIFNPYDAKPASFVAVVNLQNITDTQIALDTGELHSLLGSIERVCHSYICYWISRKPETHRN